MILNTETFRKMLPRVGFFFIDVDLIEYSLVLQCDYCKTHVEILGLKKQELMGIFRKRVTVKPNMKEI